MLRLAIIGALLTCVFGSVPKWQPRLPDHRIVGGEEADISDFPHQLSFRNGNSHTCGASIISSKWALTAAHCISQTFGYTISAGSTNRRDGTVYDVKRIVVHPNFSSSNFNFDYALLEIDGEIEFGPKVQPIRLAERELEAGSTVIVTGWGTTYSGSSVIPQDLLKVSVPIVARKDCKTDYAYVNAITVNMICAGFASGGKDACQGDSGGPLVADNVLYGIVSWGLGCAQARYPGVYSNVATARSWIKQVSGV